MNAGEPTLRFAVPRVDPAALARCLAAEFRLEGSLAPLPGERDRNFVLTHTGGARYVAKVANAEEDRAILELQHAALARIEERDGALTLPRVVKTRSGGSIATLDIDGVPHLVRVLTWVPGVPLATTTPRSLAQLRSLGEMLGRVHLALEGFEHPAAKRTLKWDLGQAAWIEAHWDRITSPGRRALAQRMYRPFREQVVPHWASLPASVIYGDANDYNVLVAEDTRGSRPVVSLIDFGDMVYSATIADLAIGIAYACLDQDDPLAAAVAVVEGYRVHRSLGDREIEALFPCVAARLVVSAVNAALQRTGGEDNDYLFISEAPVWRLLEALSAVHPRFATYRLRAAAGLEPCAVTHRVTRWIEAHRDSFIPVIPITEGVLPPRVDLSIGSEMLDDFRLINDEPRLTRRISALRRETGARVAIGEYDEPRLLYTSELFRTRGFEGDEWRTLHIGLDLFTDAGCPVRLPIAGRVHGVRNNAGPRDYGPTVIVEHKVSDADGPFTFYTLYGHLDMETLSGVSPGQPLPAGATVGRLGGPHVNGGWSPHLHFQIIVDLLDREGEFPGVARPSARTVWLSLSPAPHALASVPDTRRRPTPTAAELTARRRQRLGGSLSLAYRNPVHVVRGWMQHLYDADGRRYLDAVNNVPHVGHSHPRVVRAGQRQMAVLNTNTRYLHETVLRYAERLSQLLPDPLSVCFFVNSGSEANELALRLARTHTGRTGTLVVDGAYHGNTAALVALSPYKCEGAGGSGLAPFARKLPMPDRYRGEFRGDEPEVGERYAAATDEAIYDLNRAGMPVAAFLAESILSCGGQIVLPPGYLEGVYRRVRAAGGVCIADEVQVGFGRIGSHFWAFETQQVVPDIVVMGKPAGNGHPLGIVVTTPEIAASFDNGMEFFSTFGGNPVSAAIGLAVLDVLFDEDLQARALTTGAHLLAGLRGLAGRHEAVGDVRGLGLFAGIELVSDRKARTPDAAGAAHLANRMRELGVFVSTDGPAHNVIKIKPPLCFGKDDADLLIGTLDRVLGEDAFRS